MEIQNNSSDVNTHFQSETNKKNHAHSFSREVEKNNTKENNSLGDNLSYQKLKNMSAEEINDFYTDKRQSILLNTLKLSTAFSGNSSMNEAMFNMVLSKGTLEDSQAFLSNMISNRNSYLSNKNEDHGVWLRKSIINQIEDPKIQNEQIEIEKQFQYTMLQFDVAQHISDMMDFSKKGREENKDNNSLSFMYNNSYIQYQSLFQEYESIENKNSELLKQQLQSNSLNSLLL